MFKWHWTLKCLYCTIMYNLKKMYDLKKMVFCKFYLKILKECNGIGQYVLEISVSPKIHVCLCKVTTLFWLDSVFLFDVFYEMRCFLCAKNGELMYKSPSFSVPSIKYDMLPWIYKIYQLFLWIVSTIDKQ
jgi:hypothetical protein